MTYAATLVRSTVGEPIVPPPGRSCRGCELGWEHCHEAMLIHGTDELECTTPHDCRLAIELHMLTVDCADLWPACHCGE